MKIGYVDERQAAWKVCLKLWGYLVFGVILMVMSVVIGAVLGALLAIGAGWLETTH